MDILNKALAVMKSPNEFFRSMPKSGGYKDPLIFSVVLGVVTGGVHAVLLMLGLKPAAGVVMAILAVVITPIMVAVLGFIGAAIFWVGWKLLGSSESYEVSYRCGAYASGIAPATAIAGVIPFIGGAIGSLWMSYVLIAASVEVHGISKKKSMIAFGSVGVLFALLSVTGQVAQRAMKGQVEQMLTQNQAQLEQAQANMTPEQKQAMNAMLDLLKKSADQK